jgi:hypothetical protein
MSMNNKLLYIFVNVIGIFFVLFLLNIFILITRVLFYKNSYHLLGFVALLFGENLLSNISMF